MDAFERCLASDAGQLEGCDNHWRVSASRGKRWSDQRRTSDSFRLGSGFDHNCSDLDGPARTVTKRPNRPHPSCRPRPNPWLRWSCPAGGTGRPWRKQWVESALGGGSATSLTFVGDRFCLLAKGTLANGAAVRKWNGDASRWSSSSRSITGFSGMGRFPAEQHLATIANLVLLFDRIWFSDSLLGLCLVTHKDDNSESIHLRIRQPSRGSLTRLFPCGRAADSPNPPGLFRHCHCGSCDYNLQIETAYSNYDGQEN